MQSVVVAPELFQPQHGGRVAALAWRKKGSVLEVKASGAMKFSLAVGRKSTPALRWGSGAAARRWASGGPDVGA